MIAYIYKIRALIYCQDSLIPITRRLLVYQVSCFCPSTASHFTDTRVLTLTNTHTCTHYLAECRKSLAKRSNEDGRMGMKDFLVFFHSFFRVWGFFTCLDLDIDSWQRREWEMVKIRRGCSLLQLFPFVFFLYVEWKKERMWCNTHC